MESPDNRSTTQDSSYHFSKITADPYSWPHNGPFDPNTTALVVIDMQKDFCHPSGYLAVQGADLKPIQTIIPRIQELLTFFRKTGGQIYHTREGHRPDLSTLSSQQKFRSALVDAEIGSLGPLGRILVRGEEGHDIISELQPQPNEPIIDKPGRSAFQYTDFKLLLDIKGIRYLVICGVTTDQCVITTMRNANDMGYDCLVVEDACCAISLELHNSALSAVKAEGGILGAVSTTKQVLQSMMQK